MTIAMYQQQAYQNIISFSYYGKCTWRNLITLVRWNDSALDTNTGFLVESPVIFSRSTLNLPDLSLFLCLISSFAGVLFVPPLEVAA